MIIVSHLSRHYNQTRAVDDISFEIAANEVVALIGLNGAGKTTTLRMLTGFLAPTSGNIQIGGMSLSDDSLSLRQQIGFLPEKPALYNDMTIEDFLRYMYRLRRLTKENETEALESTLDILDLKDRRHQIIGTLSMGYRKRVSLGQSLIHAPAVLLLDEPFADLDPQQIIEIRNLIIKLQENHSIIVSSHLLVEVDKLANRYLFIDQGRIIAQETRESLRSKIQTSNNFQLVVQQNSSTPDTKEEQLISKLQSELIDIEQIEIIKGPAHQDKNQIKIRIQSAKDIRSEIAKIVINNGFDLLQLQNSQENLEQFFMKLTGKKVA